MTVVRPSSFRPVKAVVPSHLDTQERDLFTTIVANYRLRDEVSLKILEEGLTSLQRARKAREQIDAEGLTFVDKFGQPRLHPACNVERDSRAAALAAFRQLNLELPRSPVIS
jgi:hypothetical protein